MGIVSNINEKYEQSLWYAFYGLSLADQLDDFHKMIGEIGYYLIGLHTISALFHHYIQKDNTLLRMLPFGNKD